VDALGYLTGLALLFIIGIVAIVTGHKLHISRILPLVLVGILFANLGLSAFGVFDFPASFMVGLSLLTLAMIVFDGTSRFTLQDIEKGSSRALEMVIIFIVANLLLVGSATIWLLLDWTVEGVLMAAIFAVVISGTDPGSVFIMLGETKHKVLSFLRLEAILNTPIVVIIPFLILDIMNGVAELSVTGTFSGFVIPFLRHVIVGIGTGVVLGIIVFKVMRRYYSKSLSPLFIMAATIMTYVVAENLSGNGVIAVATLGLLFGNTYVKKKSTLTEFSTMLATSLEILVFILVGMLVTIDFDWSFFFKSLALFTISIIARYAAVLVTMHSTDYKEKEKLFMALNMPKGIAVAVVVLTLSVMGTQLNGIITLMILFLVYSLILSSITDRFGKFFIRKEIVASPETAPATSKAKK
jgi:NhaP-type Na+/H+ or K+/H+ antiporter